MATSTHEETIWGGQSPASVDQIWQDTSLGSTAEINVCMEDHVVCSSQKHNRYILGYVTYYVQHTARIVSLSVTCGEKERR